MEIIVMSTPNLEIVNVDCLRLRAKLTMILFNNAANLMDWELN